MKKIIHYIPGYKKGGIESLFLEITEKLCETDYKIDLLVERGLSEINQLDRELLINLNVEVIEIAPFSPKYLLQHIYNLYSVLKFGDYDCIHSHSLGKRCIPLVVAKYLKIPCRILHAHTTLFESHKLINKIGTYISKKNCTKGIAVSNLVAKNMFGKKFKNYTVIYNGIDLERFKYQKLNENSESHLIKFVHVGRFTYAKNHLFLLKVFKNLVNIDSRIKLTLVGSGEEEDNIKKYINDNQLSNYVEILSPTTNIPKLLANSHYVIFPSIYEGFSISLLEFQAMGLMCFVSNTVTEESNIGGCIFLDLNDSPKKWASFIYNKINSIDRSILVENMNFSRIDILTTIDRIEYFYKSI